MQLEKIRPEISNDVASSSTLPGSFYRDPDIFEAQKESIFARSWQFIADSSQVDKDNTQLPITVLEGCLDEPLLLTNSQSDGLSLLSNVCTHRGSILVDEKRVSSKISCRYHGRCFSMAGDYISAPGFEKACDFPSKSDDLPSLSLERFGNFLFASINPEWSFNEYIGEMKSRIGWLPLENCRLDSSNSRVYMVDANWALYIDNYLEGLHIPYVHPGLASILDTKNYKVELNKSGNLQVGIATSEEDSFDIPESSPDHGKNIAAYYYWLFPNTMFNFYTWGVSVNIIEPLAVDKTRIRFLTYVYDQSKMGSYSPESIDVTEQEDEAVVEAVAKGIKSRLYKKGRYAPGWEDGVHQFHRFLTERL